MLRAGSSAPAPRWRRFLEALAHHQPETYAALLTGDRLPCARDVDDAAASSCPDLQLAGSVRHFFLSNRKIRATFARLTPDGASERYQEPDEPVVLRESATWGEVLARMTRREPIDPDAHDCEDDDTAVVLTAEESAYEIRKRRRQAQMQECDRAIESARQLKAALLKEQEADDRESAIEEPMKRFRRALEAACRT